MTEEQERMLATDERYLVQHDRKVYELLSEQGISWHPFGAHVIFDSPYHNIQHEDPMYVLETTLYHRAAEQATRKGELSVAGLLTPEGKTATIPAPAAAPKGGLITMDLKEEK